MSHHISRSANIESRSAYSISESMTFHHAQLNFGSVENSENEKIISLCRPAFVSRPMYGDARHAHFEDDVRLLQKLNASKYYS